MLVRAFISIDNISGALSELDNNLFYAFSSRQNFIRASSFLNETSAGFCVSVSLSDNLFQPGSAAFKEFVDELIALSFYRQYLQFTPGTPFFLFGDTDINSDAYIAAIEREFQQHGYAAIDFLTIKPQTPGAADSVAHCHFISGKEDLVARYAEILKNCASGDAIVIEVTDEQKTSGVCEAVIAAEQQFKMQSPQLYKMMLSAKELHDVKRALQIDNALLLEDVESQKFYRISPENEYKKKVKEIAKFYNYEYEILPLWYKRFGHVIKVVMGKRTFRSLFNDNVKKYKV